jgi:hypothetical protein
VAGCQGWDSQLVRDRGLTSQPMSRLTQRLVISGVSRCSGPPPSALLRLRPGLHGARGGAAYCFFLRTATKFCCGGGWMTCICVTAPLASRLNSTANAGSSLMK